MMIAFDPVPEDGAEYLDPNAITLGWEPGFGAKLHHLYFGTSYDDVLNGTGGTDKGLVAIGHDPGPLAEGTTYYWRIDEFDGAQTYTGDIWSFTTMPHISIGDPNLVGWWKMDEGTGPLALDWSGHGNHGTLIGDTKWVQGYDGGAIELDGNGDYVDTGYTTNLAKWTIAVWVISPAAPAASAPTGPVHREKNFQINWNHTQLAFRGAAALRVGGTWYSASFGTLKADTWYHLAATYDGETLNTYKNGVLVTSNTAPSGAPDAESGSLKFGRHAVADQYFEGKIDDVRVYDFAMTLDQIKKIMRGDPRLAWDPHPTDGSTVDVYRALPLTWKPGDLAIQHDIYLGTGRDIVDDANTSTAGIYRGTQPVGSESYTPTPALEFGQTYYWRIDERNTDGSVTKGRVWSFTLWRSNGTWSVLSW